MRCVDRKGNEIGENAAQGRVLKALYETAAGRILLGILVKPFVSKAGGFLLNQPVSKAAIAPFIKKNHIDMTDYEEREYRSYNDFFTRKVKPGHRKFDRVKENFCAPCDSRLSIYPITAEGKVCVKDTEYTMESLFRSRKIARHYEGGILCIFRLTVDDYHHYSFVDDGRMGYIYRIPGVFHTVNPLAGEIYPIYKENTREFSVLKSQHFGNILMMEVGALMVGRICNEKENCPVHRGEEKGKFEFGGSTVILCLEKDRVELDADIVYNSNKGVETKVRQGEKIGRMSEWKRMKY
ncbi:MAG: phosphatidylserine decarboxylase [Roseburia sp.]